MNAQASKPTYEVAISGYACRLPAAPDPEAFWSILEAGRCVVTEVQSSRWSKARYFHPDKGALGRSYTFAAGQVEDIWDFDAGFFGVSPREAAQMDPQQRILLTAVWEAVEHAGLRPEELSKGRTGVYIGASSSDHSFTFLSDPASVDSQFMTGNTLSIVSNRISYLLDLHGPSYTVDTACSSSFYAFHQAVQALKSGEIDTAIVGGVNALLSPFAFIGFSRATMLSPTGLCKAFDSSADGYVRSEGAVAFVLRRMDVAQDAGDPVRGVVVGTGVNSDGRTVGMSMPSSERQAALLKHIRRELQFDPDDLAFLECHGTGTPVGDPLEAHAIGEVFGRGRARPLPIGSAKTNFGHLEPASGLVGLLKAQMALEKGVYPASLHVTELNPNIAFDDLNLEVATEPVALEAKDRPWLAGVNSFGFGGANAHVVIRQPEAAELPHGPAAPKARALVVTASSREALADMASRWRDRLSSASEAEADRLVNAAAWRRQRGPHRLIALGDGAAGIAAALAEEPEGGAHVLIGQRVGRGEKTAFVFGGNGSQWAGMGLDLYEENPVFRAAFDEVAELFGAKSELDLAELLVSDDLAERLGESRVAQPILFAVQVALVKALEAEGLRPDAVAGHSVGEVAAAWAAGVLTLKDAVHLIRTRSTALEFMRGQGGMAAVLAGEEAVEAALAEFGDASITVAADNSPRSSTIAGPVESLKEFARFARKKRIAAKLLDIEYPYHSPTIDPIRAKLIEDLAELRPQPGKAVYVSSTSGREAPGVALDTEYWWRNARQPVRFREAVSALAKLGCGVFVEIAPRPVLQSYVTDSCEALGWGASVVATLDQNPRIAPTARAIAAKAAAHGARLDDRRFFGAPAPYRGGLPGYAWKPTEFRVKPGPEAVDFFGGATEHPLLGWRLRPGEGVWRNVIDVALTPWLADHKVDGAAILPAAAFAEMALAAGAAAHGLPELSEFEILRPISLDDGAVETRVSHDQSTGQVRIESRRRLAGGEWGLNAFGLLRKNPAPGVVAAHEVKGAAKLNGRQLYGSLESFGLGYGPAFQRIKSARVNGAAAEARLTEPVAAIAAGALMLDPTAFDGAMHAIFPLIRRLAGEAALRPGVAFLPVRIGRLRLHGAGAAPRRAVVKLARLTPRGAEAEIELFAEDGAPVASISGLRLKAVALRGPSRESGRVWRQAMVRLAAADESAAVPASWEAPAARLSALGLAAETAPEPDVGSLLSDALARRLAWDLARRFADEEGRVDIAAALDLDPSGRPLLARALLALEEDGVFAAEGLGAGVLAAECPYPPVEELVQALSEEAPARGPDLMALLRVEAEAPERLRSGLAEASPAPNLADVSPAARAVWSSVEAIAGDIAAEWSPTRRLELLVVGAAPIGAALRLARLPAVSRITLTDPDARVVETMAQALETARREAPKLRLLPFAEAAAAGADAAILGDALHRAGRDGLAALSAGLAHDAILAAVERAPDLATDLQMGLSAAWWAGSLAPEAPVGRRQPAEDWRAAIEAARFDAVEAAPLREEQAELVAFFGRARRRPAAASSAAAPVAILYGPAELESAEALEAAFAAVGRPVRILPAEGAVAFAPDEEAVLLAGLMDDEADDLARASGRIAAVHSILAMSKPARLWLPTRGGRPAAAGAEGARRPAEAALHGLARVLNNEPGMPELRTVDFDPDFDGERLIEALAAEIAAPSEEREILIDEAGRAAPRIEGAPGLLARAADAEAGAEAMRRLEIGREGHFDSLRWAPATRRAPRPDEVEIEIRAAGLNFRDVMWAQGLLPDEALEEGFAGATLGMECAGVVSRAGAASGRKVGEAVIAFGPACFATHTTIPARATASLPAGTEFETAAAAPTIFVTAQYALVELARLRAGETVLIHGGAGGVGLAAIQIARRIGARVLATAGSPAKRRLLSALGAEAVFDSRSLTFADGVMAATGGEGVDVALNSLAGEAMERTLGCLKAFGRFVELGKRDYYGNTPLGLRPFRRNLSYFGVDADQLLSARPDIADRLMRDLAEGFESGACSPPPVQDFEADEAVDAFRLMQKSGHIGKIVIRPPAAPATPVAPAAPIGEGAWLVVGGTGGFGLETAAWLAGKGVRTLFLASRSGLPPKEGKGALAQIRKTGANVVTVAADAADPKAVEGLMAEIAASGVPLKGVIHSAMVLDDAMFETLDPARIEAVMRPKIAGAALLDRATRGMGLDHFITYSSVTTLFGNPGQAPYVAANAYLESLMAARREAGEPGLAVGWGPIADVGVLARDEAVRDFLARRMGGTLLTAAEALDGLDKVLAAGAPEAAITFAPLRWGMLAGDLPLLSTPLFDRIETAREAGGAGEGAIDLAAMIEGLDDAAALKAIIEFLATETGRILRQPPGELDPRRPLTEMGFDSLMAVDLKMAVEERVGAALPLMSLSEGVGLADLARKLLDEARGRAGGAAGEGEAAVGAVVAQHVGARLDESDRKVVERLAREAESLKQ